MKFRFNYTLFKNWSCVKFVTSEDEDTAKNKFFELVTSETVEGKKIKKKDVVIDLFEEISVKKKRKR